MLGTIEAIYENGVLKPLSPIELKEHEKVIITIEKGTSAVRASSGMFNSLDDSSINEIALSPEFLSEEA